MACFGIQSPAANDAAQLQKTAQDFCNIIELFVSNGPMAANNGVASMLSDNLASPQFNLGM